MPLQAIATKKNGKKMQSKCQLPQGWGQMLMSNPHLGCGDAWGWGLGLKLTSAS